MPRKLLLADDSITIQKVVELVLSEEDFQIKAVNNGDEAVNQIEVFKPDIVLADIEMPGTNGYQLCERIKQNPDTAHMAVVLLAGAFEPLDEDLARNVRADDFIIKPFESQELISKINAVLASAGTQTVTEQAAAAVPEPDIGVIEETAVAEAVEATEAFEDAQAIEPAEAVEATEVMGTATPADDLWAIDGGEEAEVVAEAAPMAEAGEALAAEFSEEMTVDDQGMQLESGTQAEMVMDVAPQAERVVSQTPPPAQPAAVPAPSAEEVAAAVASSVQRQVGSVINSMDIKSMVAEAIKPMIMASIENTIQEVVPGILKESVSDLLKGSVEKQVENVIWETVPDLAESLIKKEIEKIKSEF